MSFRPAFNYRFSSCTSVCRRKNYRQGINFGEYLTVPRPKLLVFTAKIIGHGRNLAKNISSRFRGKRGINGAFFRSVSM